MTKRLVIAEKPSVGMSIAAVLGVKDRKDGYIEGRDYIVSWGYGHLAELANADTYDEKYAKWNYADLPIVPVNWKYKIPRDKYSQFEVLKKLMNRDDVSDVINACDAGREGELIFRNIYKMTGCKKPIYRLWISSMEDEAIKQGFRELTDGKEYDNLFAAARCREWADWLVGINATRLFSVLYHRTLNVGRVVSPTLALLVQREAEIGAFKPEPYYTAELDFGTFTAVSEKYKKKSEADAVIPKANENVKVQSVTSKDKTEKAPALYDLTTLQRDANRQLGYTAQQTLDYVQSLYEKKLCTYPRTDSRYLTEDMENTVPAMVACAAGICGMDMPPAVLSRQICDSKRGSDHHAIIPTIVAGESDISALSMGEREILTMIAKHVLRAISGKYRYRETVAEILCGTTVFTAKGKTVVEVGWKAYTDSEQAEFERDVPVYMLYDDNSEGMAFETEDIVLFSGCFGISREDWEAIKDEVPPMDAELIRKKREQAFLESAADTYAIYQLKRNEDTANLRFESYSWLEQQGLEPQHGNYDLVYTGTLTSEGSQIDKLEDLYRVFNIEHPQDFTGHSLSVSDIVALKQAGVISYHYVDSIGYKELPNFMKPENYLKNAEMQMEDDYGMIDGIINNGAKEEPKPVKQAEEIKSKKPSVLAKLRKYQAEDRREKTQHRSAERDLI